MANDRPIITREAMEREQARLLEEAAAIEREAAAKKAAAEIIARDMVEYDRLIRTYGAPAKPPEAAGLTVEDLVRHYRTDKRSAYHTVRYKSRRFYDDLSKRVLKDCGRVTLANLKIDDIQRLYESWSDGGKKITIGRALVGMLRALVNFGANVLDDGDCVRLSVNLRSMRFSAPKPRTELLTTKDVVAICAMAHKMGFPSIALAQAFQHYLKLPQKDVIGEWVPISEKEPSDIEHEGWKWLRGIRWNEIDENLILRHTTSNRLKDIEIDLKLVPAVKEELEPIFGMRTSGALIECETTGRPWKTGYFQKQWRKIATAAGVPKTVRNTDNRADDSVENDAVSEPERAAEHKLNGHAKKERATDVSVARH